MTRGSDRVVLGILSDTHGLLRELVVRALEGSDLILHAGDVGSMEILERLREVAPVHAVRGNVDTGRGVGELPESLRLEVAGLAVGMVHRREELGDRGLGDCDLQVFGHSHAPELRWLGGRLLLNPGACGRRRFRLPLTVARVTVHSDAGRLVPELLAVEDE